MQGDSSMISWWTKRIGSWRGTVVGSFLLLLAAVFACGAQPPAASDAKQSEPAESNPPISTAQARERAKLLHGVYAATLEVLHDRYFHDERAIVPARAMEDVFTEQKKQTKIKARWISVNTKAMSLNHEPKTDFEKQAAAAISAGKAEFELVEKDLYRRAAGIELTGGCVSCHTGFFAGEPKSPRFAGLVIEIPISEK